MTPNKLTLQCASGQIATVDFASYGTPTGSCGDWHAGACAAANSSAIITAACLGRTSCSIWPNTSTFGDPCFGTAKELAVQFTCSGGGSGDATCDDTPAPPTPPVTIAVTATISFSSPTITLSTTPSLQVVSQRLLLPWSGSIYTNAWAALKHLTSLGLQSVRFVPWIPYAKMGVAELDPPSGTNLCGPSMWTMGQLYDFSLDCGDSTIATVDFASWGNAQGTCGAYTPGSCNDPTSVATVQAACVGKASCTLGPALFNGTCASVKPYLAVQVRCSDPAKQHTYWNFTWVDQLALDFWDAANGDATSPIPNWSTQPTWMYDSKDYTYPDDPTVAWYGYDRGTAPAGNVSALGDYYGRLLSWYTQGGFADEYGVLHTSGHKLNISVYEVFNEVDYEHGHTPESYTVEFDAVVAGIRRWTGSVGAAMRFVALSLPNIDDAAKVEAWVTYFYNSSNHDPATWDAAASGLVGFHSYPTDSFGPWTKDPSSLQGLFTYVDSFVAEVGAVATLLSTLAPNVRIALDESGVDMSQVLSGGAPPDDNPPFWVAGGSYWTYLWALAAGMGETVHVVAQSQFMDAPGQEPAVSMLDWTTGVGTAKYWSVDLLLRTTGSGDGWVSSSTSNATALHAQGYTHGPTSTPSILLISKLNANTNVSVAVSGPPSSTTFTCAAECVDEDTGLGPARAVPCAWDAAHATASVSILRFATCVVTLGQ